MKRSEGVLKPTYRQPVVNRKMFMLPAIVTTDLAKHLLSQAENQHSFFRPF